MKLKLILYNSIINNIKGLRDNKIKCLIATNVAARGLDLP